MKTLKKNLLNLMAFALICCIASCSSSSNPFEPVTKLFAKLDEKGAVLRDAGPRNVTLEQTQAFMEEVESTMKEVEVEAEKLIGKKVPFSGNAFKLLNVEDVFIFDAKKKAADCEVKIKVLCKPIKDITVTAPDDARSLYKFTFDGESEADATCSLYAMQYVVFIDNAGKVMDYKKFKPFLSGDYEYQYKAGDKITPSQYCNDAGNILNISLARGKFHDFKEIRFVTESELETLLNVVNTDNK